MNKQIEALKLAEEALVRIEQIDGVYSWADALDAVREALAEPYAETNETCSDLNIKQEPIGMVIGGVFEPWNDDVLSGAWELYAAPVDAKTIRAEALEEAAKFVEYVNQLGLETDCAAAIRGLK